MEAWRDERPESDPSRAELIQLLASAGLYHPKGTTPEQRAWVRERDGNQCQFFEPRMEGDRLAMVQCGRRYPDGQMPKKGSQRWRLEVHHIVPQSEMRSDPKSWGGENPYNLITLCAGLAGEIGHHDIMQPTMVIAKMTYRTDPSSYQKWIEYAHRAREIEGMGTYNREWDGMLKTVAKTRTIDFVRRSGQKFPYRKES